jgi:ribosomal protein L29
MKKNEIKKLSKIEREKKLKELKNELIKVNGKLAEKGSSKKKEIKKMIARILTFNKLENKLGKLKNK